MFRTVEEKIASILVSSPAELANILSQITNECLPHECVKDHNINYIIDLANRNRKASTWLMLSATVYAARFDTFVPVQMKLFGTYCQRLKLNDYMEHYDRPNVIDYSFGHTLEGKVTAFNNAIANAIDRAAERKMKLIKAINTFTATTATENAQ